MIQRKNIRVIKGLAVLQKGVFILQNRIEAMQGLDIDKMEQRHLARLAKKKQPFRRNGRTLTIACYMKILINI